MAAVAPSTSLAANGETITISTESRVRARRVAARTAPTSAGDNAPDAAEAGTPIESAVGPVISRAAESNSTSASPGWNTERAAVATSAPVPPKRERSTTTTRAVPFRRAENVGRASATPTSTMIPTRSASSARSAGCTARDTMRTGRSGAKRAVGSGDSGGLRHASR
jgi:hypothetical protein